MISVQFILIDADNHDREIQLYPPYGVTCFAQEGMMDDELTSTIRLVRRPKVATNDVGGTVWIDSVESIEVELVSTMMLEVMLDADEGTTRQKLQDLDMSGDGVLAHNAKDARFEVVQGRELKAALDDSARSRSAAANASNTQYEVEQICDDLDELSLVSTQMIEVMIKKPELSPQEVSEELQLLEDVKASGGFDPYNNS